MKPLLLSTYDSAGGAARAAYRLHEGLLGIGVDSRMLVQHKGTGDPRVIGPMTRFQKLFAKAAPRLEEMQLRRYPRHTARIFTAAGVPDRLASRIAAAGPDVLHLHWVAHGFLKVETLARLGKPLVWTLHDMWTFTGGCHYDERCGKYRESCGSCPQLGAGVDDDLSRRIWRRKRESWAGLPLTLVTPSRWLAREASSSSLFRDARIEVIPNGLDLERFKPFDRRMARQLLSLPLDRKLILFGALGSLRDARKGSAQLLEAIRGAAPRIKDRATVVIFGDREPAEAVDYGIPAIYAGELRDEASLRALYSAADVFVAPSLQENLANTVMESLACGTPCVAYDIGGMPDLISHQESGFLARPFEASDLAAGIEWVLADDARAAGLSRQARAKVEREFALPAIAGRYRDLYEEVSRVD